MRRVKFCCVILLIIIVLSSFSLYIINKSCDNLTDEIHQIQELYQKKDTKSALEKTEELNLSWEKTYKLLSCLVKHEKLSEINSSIARFRPFIENGNDELTAEFGSALYQIDLLCETEFPYLHNIL